MVFHYSSHISIICCDEFKNSLIIFKISDSDEIVFKHVRVHILKHTNNVKRIKEVNDIPLKLDQFGMADK